jgi:thymidylate synthase
MEEDYQLNLRGDGKIPIISIEAENLAEATHKAIIACYDYGLRTETPKSTPGMTLGYDADMTVKINNPASKLNWYDPGMHNDVRGVMQYILEVTHGIHNYWKKDEKNPLRWGYTYNERFVNQLPFVFQKIKKDWNEKKRFGRDSQYTIWRAEEDVIPEQDDPPCFQRGQIRILKNNGGKYVMNYQTDWRSRDLFKAFNDNNMAQIELMKLYRAFISKMLGIDLELGAYIDHSSSLHLYGLYFERDGLEQKINSLKTVRYTAKSRNFDEYIIGCLETKDSLKRLIAAQMAAEKDGHGLNLGKNELIEKGYNLETFPYPADWDTWPDSWNRPPEKSLLDRQKIT